MKEIYMLVFASLSFFGKMDQNIDDILRYAYFCPITCSLD